MSLSGSRSQFHLSIDDGLPPVTQDPGFFYEGTTGDDPQTGSGFDDGFDFSQGGNDTLNGLGGADEFFMGGAFTAADTINGGTGNDTLFLHGDYHVSQQLLASTLTSVENIVLQRGFTYSFVLADANIAAGTSLTVDAHDLGKHEFAFISAAGETDGSIVYYGGHGTDSVIGTNAEDVFLGNAGDDSFTAKNGNDTFLGGAGDDNVGFIFSFNNSDFVDGGSGYDKLFLTVFGGTSLALTPTFVQNFEEIDLRPGAGSGTATFTLTTDDAVVAAGKTLQIVGSDEGANKFALTFNGSSELDGHFDVTGADADDAFTGGALSDTFHLEAGGNDTVHGGGGSDVVFAGSAFTASDVFDGGDGIDTLNLDGAYLLSFQTGTLMNVETVVLTAGNNYVLGASAGAVAAGDTLTVDGSALDSANGLAWDSSGVSDAHFRVAGGKGADHIVGGAVSDTLDGGAGADQLWGLAGNDTLNGGNGNDTLIGLDGVDIMNGGNGNDQFQYGAVGQSTGVHFDTVIGFDTNDDVFAFVDVTGVDAQVTAGELSESSFNHDLAAAIGKHELRAGHAVIFAPGLGDFAGSLFLIIDANGKAGYQANKDLVVLLQEPLHIAHLATDNFHSS